MIRLLVNKKIIAAAGVTLIIVVVAIVTLFILNKRQYPFENLLITTGGSLRATGFDGMRIDVADEDKGKEYNLPVTTKLAFQEGWYKASQCVPGEGIYFTKAEEKAIILIFDVAGNLIGIYQHSDIQMPVPWVKTQGPLKNDGSTIINYEHYGVYFFLIDPSKSCDSETDYESVLISNSTLPSYSIPVKSEIAKSRGWIDPIFCSPGRGKYYKNNEFNHVLMYNANGNAIGIYQHTLNQMPFPWFKTKEIIGGGSIPVIEVEHYGFFIYFEDPMDACQRPDSKSVGTGGTSYAGPKAVRSEYKPTPTHTPALDAAETINNISESLSSASKTFKVTNPANESSIATGITSSQVADLLSSLTDAQEGTGKWIDNISYKGLTGNTGSITTILTSATSDTLTVSLWVNDNNEVNLIEITGTITHGGSEITKLSISPE
jgi:hypothetical protein